MTTEPSTTSDQHTADEAGGESIFSSDGLAPLSLPPPPYCKKNIVNEKDDTVLDSETSNPMQAFEIFQGRIFPPRGEGGIRIGSTVISAESTMMKLARIERELKELEFEQQHEGTEETTTSTQDVAIRGKVEELSKRLLQLQTNSMSGTYALKQNDLTSQVRKEMDKLSKATTKKGDDITEEKEEGRVVYELYSTPQNQSDSTSDRQPSDMTVEQIERLNRIEALLGSNSSMVTTTSGLSLLERLKQAEENFTTLDEKTLDTAAARARVIRADLEAAAKARTKIAALKTGDTKSISKLHDALVDLDGFLSSNTLSIIVQRLQACAALHGKASEFHNSLVGLEQNVNDVEGLIRNVEENLAVVEKGMVQNMDIIRKSMDDLDKKL